MDKLRSYFLILLVGISAVSIVSMMSYLNNAYAENATMSENMNMNGNMSTSENLNMSENMNMTNDQNMSSSTMENMSSSNTENMKVDTSNAMISKVITRNYGTNDVFSLVFVRYDGDLHINHVVAMQTNSGVQMAKAWIAPKWDSQMSGDSLTFHSDKASITKGKTLVILVITDSTPAFNLISAESHSGK